mgnify:CR=1 FL=1
MSHESRSEEVRDNETSSSNNSSNSASNVIHYISGDIMGQVNMRPSLASQPAHYQLPSIAPNIHPHQYTTSQPPHQQHYHVVHTPISRISSENGQQQHMMPPSMNPTAYQGPEQVIIDHGIPTFQYAHQPQHVLRSSIMTGANMSPGQPQPQTIVMGPQPIQHAIDGHLASQTIATPMGTTLLTSSAQLQGQKTKKNTKRAMQNRKAQKAFRQRKEQYIKLLENEAKLIDDVMKKNQDLTSENEQLRDCLNRLIEKLKDNGIEVDIPSDFLDKINASISASRRLQEQHEETSKSIAGEKS